MYIFHWGDTEFSLWVGPMATLVNYPFVSPVVLWFLKISTQKQDGLKIQGPRIAGTTVNVCLYIPTHETPKVTMVRQSFLGKINLMK